MELVPRSKEELIRFILEQCKATLDEYDPDGYECPMPTRNDIRFLVSELMKDTLFSELDLTFSNRETLAMLLRAWVYEAAEQLLIEDEITSSMLTPHNIRELSIYSDIETYFELPELLY